MSQVSALALAITVSLILSTIVAAVMTEPLRELLLEYGIDPEDPATFLVLDEGLRFTESDATIHVITAPGGVWQLANAARVVPRCWRDVIYRLLARNRYRWFGRRSTCYLPN